MTSKAILLNCFHCKQRYCINDSPRVVPCCGQTFCNACISLIEASIKNGQYKCIECKEVENLPEKGFVFNTKVAKILREETVENKNEKSSEEKLSLESLLKLKQKLLYQAYNGESIIKDHYLEQKRLIILASKRIRKEVEQICERYNEEITKFKKTTIRNIFNLNQDEKRESFLKDPQRFSRNMFGIDDRIQNRIFLLEVIKKLKQKLVEEKVSINKNMSSWKSLKTFYELRESKHKIIMEEIHGILKFVPIN